MDKHYYEVNKMKTKVSLGNNEKRFEEILELANDLIENAGSLTYALSIAEEIKIVARGKGSDKSFDILSKIFSQKRTPLEIVTKFEFSPDELREALGASKDKYPGWGNVMQIFINPFLERSGLHPKRKRLYEVVETKGRKITKAAFIQGWGDVDLSLPGEVVQVDYNRLK